MYNRSNIIYKQKSTTNKDFQVTAATIYDTGTDISLDFKVDGQIKEPLTPEVEFYRSLPEGHELKTIEILNYIDNKMYNTPEYQEFSRNRMEAYLFEKYLINEVGEKFELTQGPRANGSGRIDEKDAPIVVVSREDGSGTRGALRNSWI